MITSADGKGGAIFIEDSNSCESILNVDGRCSIDFNDSEQGVKLFFFNNTATHGPVCMVAYWTDVLVIDWMHQLVWNISSSIQSMNTQH